MRFYSQFWCEFSELNWALLLWFWFYSILFWSNLNVYNILFVEFMLEFFKKLLILIRIIQLNLSWIFYVEEVFSERFWFYLILFWSNLTSATTFLLNLCFKFCKKSLNLIRILQSNLSWFFYKKRDSSERFWFYLDLF